MDQENENARAVGDSGVIPFLKLILLISAGSTLATNQVANNLKSHGENVSI